MIGNISFRAMLMQWAMAALISWSAADPAADTPDASQAILGGGKTESRNPFNEDFKRYVQEQLDHWKVPGLAIAVIDGDDIFAEGFGWATVNSTPVTPSTLFFTGGTTQAFTAAMFTLLMDNHTQYNDIHWTTPVSSIIPSDFVLEDEWATRHITVEDILSHRTGLPDHISAYADTYEGRPSELSDIVKSLRYLPMTAEPRTGFQYGSLMYIIASHVLETITGHALGTLLHEYIWTPLGMDRTYFSLKDAEASGHEMATGYDWDPVTDSIVEVPHRNADFISGAGSVISNVLDYAKWMKSLIHCAAPLSEAGHEAMRTPRAITITKSQLKGPYLYGLGFNLGTIGCVQMVDVIGVSPTSGTDFIFIPELKWGFISMGSTYLTSNLVGRKIAWDMINERMRVSKKARVDLNKSFDKTYYSTVHRFDNAAKKTYPALPDPLLPPTLPLEAYAGEYFHPAYLSFDIKIPEDYDSASNASYVLIADRPHNLFPYRYVFEHISGEYWIYKGDSPASHERTIGSFGATEFKISSTGEVVSVGIALEPEMGRKGRIWFDKVKR